MTDDDHGLLDTNILIHRRRIAPDELPAQVSISAVTLGELSFGPHATDDPDERARRLDLLQRSEAEFDPLPYDAEAARAFGRIGAAVLARGRQPRVRIADLQTAAVAMANAIPLYTTNSKDFAGIEHLVRVVSVTRPSSAGPG